MLLQCKTAVPAMAGFSRQFFHLSILAMIYGMSQAHELTCATPSWQSKKTSGKPAIDRSAEEIN